MSDSENPHAGQGSVLLDIGGDVGALVVTMPASMVGVEVDIRRLGSEEGRAGHLDGEHDHTHGHTHGHWHRPHVAVVERAVPGGGQPVPSLVYSELVDGTYELLLKGTDDVALTVDVHGGEVAASEWPSA